MTAVGEVDYPSYPFGRDVRQEVETINDRFAQARARIYADHQHFLDGGDPPLEVRG